MKLQNGKQTPAEDSRSTRITRPFVAARKRSALQDESALLNVVQRSENETSIGISTAQGR